MGLPPVTGEAADACSQNSEDESQTSSSNQNRTEGRKHQSESQPGARDREAVITRVMSCNFSIPQAAEARQRLPALILSIPSKSLRTRGSAYYDLLNRCETCAKCWPRPLEERLQERQCSATSTEAPNRTHAAVAVLWQGEFRLRLARAQWHRYPPCGTVILVPRSTLRHCPTKRLSRLGQGPQGRALCPTPKALSNATRSAPVLCSSPTGTTVSRLPDCAPQRFGWRGKRGLGFSA